MNHDWLEDIVAVLDTGSFIGAANQRNVTQSAFTRRIRAIENAIGTPLFDRRRKPVALLPTLGAQEEEIRRLAQAQRDLRTGLRAAARGEARSVTLICQHAITATVSPRIVRQLTNAGWSSVKVRSGNHDECLLQLISGLADLVISYDDPGADEIIDRPGFASLVIDRDTLKPVCLLELAQNLGSEVPVIAYPPDVFLGERIERHIWPDLPANLAVIRRAETALTLAAYHYALDGIGVAWLPGSLVADDLAAGRLVRPQGLGPDYPLDVRLIRLTESTAAAEAAWTALAKPDQ